MASNFDEFFRQNPGVLAAAKQMTVSETADTKKAEVASRASGYRAAAEAELGIDQTPTVDAWMQDLLHPNRDYSRGMGDYFRDRTADRSVDDIWKDTALSVASGFGNGVGSIAELGLGVVSDDAGAWANRQMNRFNSFIEGGSDGTRGTSDGFDARQRAYGARMQVLEEQNKAKQDAAGGGFEAAVQRWLDDASDAIEQASNDSVVFSGGLANAAGSLFAAGPVGKGLRIVGAPIARALGRRAIAGGSTLSYRAYRAGQAAEIPAAVGLMEGGGAYHQTFNEVMSMDTGDLMQKSPDFAELALKLGVDEAKKTVANRAALEAAAIQGPVGAATGVLVRKFEGNPFKPTNLEHLFKNMATETVEEGIQGGSAQLATNLAIRQNANSDRDINEGVGEQIGLGALYGLGAAGVSAGPGSIAATTGRALGRASGAAIQAVARRVAQNQANNENSSTIGDAALSRAAEEIRTEGPAIRQGLEEAINQSNASPEAKSTGLKYLDDLFNAAQFDRSRYDNDAVHPVVRQNFMEATDTYDAIKRLSGLIDTAQNEEQVAIAGEALFDLLRNNERVVSDQFADALEAIPDDHPMLPRMRQIEDVLIAYSQNPKVVSAVQKAETQFIARAQAASGQVSQANVPTAEDVQAATIVADRNPDQLDPGLADNLLYHNEQGNIRLTPNQIVALQGVSRVARASRAGVLLAGEMGLENLDEVSAQVLDDDPKSVIAHMRGVAQAIENGDTEAAKIRLEDLRDFAQHMQNKLAAVNESLKTGKKMPFQARNYETGVQYQTLAPQVHTKNANSIKTAQQIAVEAGVVAEATNQLVDLFPQLGVQKVQKIDIDPTLAKPAAEVISYYSQPKAEESKAEAKPEPEAVREPEAAPAESTELTVSEYVDRYIAGEGRNDLEMQQFAANNSEAIEAEFQRRATTEAEDPAQPKGGDQSTATENTDEVTAAPETAEPSSVEGGDTSTEAEVNARIEAAIADVDLNPTEAQKESGNYAKGHVSVQGIPITIENPKGSERTGKDSDGETWSVTMPAHYGYVKSTTGADNEQVDIYLGDSPLETTVYVIDQVDAETGVFDEHKVMFGFHSERAAERTYNQGFSDGKGPDRMGAITEMSIDEFKTWLETKQSKPLNRYVKVASEETAPETTEQSQTEEAQPSEQAPVEETARAGTDPVTEPDQQTAESDSDGDTRYSLKSLLADKVEGLTNWFVKAFKQLNIDRTRFRAGVSPLALVREAVSSPEAFALFTQGKARELTEQMSAEYTGYLSLAEPIMQALQQRLTTNLDKVKVGKLTLREALLGGDANVQTFPRAKVLAIADLNDDGSISYNPDLIEKATLAALQWVLTAEDRSHTLDEDAAAAITGLDRDEAAAYIDAIKGMSPTEAVDSLSAMIVRFWGVKVNDDLELGYARGISEAVAKELLLSMSNIKLFADSNETLTKVTDLGKELDVDFPNTVKRWEVSRFMVGKGKDAQPHPIKSLPNLLEEALIQNPELQTFVGQPPKGTPSTQLRNNIPLARQQRQAIKAAQETPHRINTRMVNFLQAIGMDGAIELFGEGDLSKRKLNINHAKSLDGKNRTIGAAFEKLMSTVAEVAYHGPLGETDLFYRYEISRANRLQMQGAHNPQASKLAREAILPTWDTLDLAKNADHKLFFHLALAQALGVKIHEKSAQASIKEVREKLAGYPETLKLLADGKFDDKTVETIKAEVGTTTPVALHAMMEYARYQQATPEQKANFQTALYIEADGVTNGPVNAMMMLTSGEFTGQWIENAKKGGMFYDGTQSTNEQRSSGALDMYGSVSSVLATFLDTKLKNRDPEDPAGQQLVTLLNVMRVLGMKIGFNEKGDLVIDRGVTKNPLTISIYGSGARGIAGNIAEEILNAAYEKFSSVLENSDLPEHLAMFSELSKGDEQLALKMHKAFIKALDPGIGLLLTQQVQEKGNMRRTKREKPRKVGKGIQDFTFDKTDFKALQENILHLIVSPMREAINETLAGDTLGNADLLRKATQLQSIKLREDFYRAVRELIERKKAGNEKFKMTDFVSRDDMKAILDKLLETNPYLKGADQNIFVSGSEDLTYRSLGGKSDDYIHVSNSLDEQFKTPISERAPANAGVAGIPLSVIALGDGHMIQLILTDENGPKGGLPVFDGFHMKLSTVREDSKKINEAARKVWFNNPMKLALEAYTTFIANNDPMDTYLLEIAKVVFGPQVIIDENGDLRGGRGAKAPVITRAAVEAEIKALPARLEKASKSIDARHQVMAKYAMTTDQMAGVAIPFVSDGIDLTGKTSDEIADIMNQEYLEIMGEAGLAPITADEPTATQTETEKPAKQELEKHETVQQFGRGKGNIRIYSQRALRQLLVKGNLSQNQKAILSEILKTFSIKDLNVLVGPRADIARALGGSDADIAQRLQQWGNAKGYMDPTTGMIAVFETGGPETLIHELVHAATFEKVLSYYQNGPENAEQGAAMAALEDLMRQFLEVDLVGQSDETVQAYEHVRQVIESLKVRNDAQGKARALNEFMAYVLANRSLGNLAQTTQVHPLVQVIKDALQAIKRFVFGRKHAPAVADDMFSRLLFNTSVVLRTELSQRQFVEQAGLFHSPQYGQDARLQSISQVMGEKLGRYIEANPEPNPRDKTAARTRKSMEVAAAIQQALSVSKFFISKGFAMTAQAQSTFSSLVSVMGTAAQLDPVVMNRLQTYYTHVEKHLKVEDFMTDPNSTNPNERYAAQQKFNVIMGNYGVAKDAHNRTSLLPSFIALAVTSDEFRAILKNVPPLKSDKLKGKNIDETMTNVMTNTLERLDQFLSGEHANHPDTLAAVDELVASLVQNARDSQTAFETLTKPAGRWLDIANQKAVDALGVLSNKGMELGQKLQGKSNKYVQLGGRITEAFSALLNEDNSKAVNESATHLVSQTKMPLALKEVLADLIGRTESNANVYDLIKLVRSSIQKARQQYREHLPKVIQDKFTRELTDQEWTALYRMGQTDLATMLNAGMSQAQVLELVTDPAKLTTKIASVESRVQQLDAQNWALLEKKSRQLANWMLTKRTGVNLLRNAYAVASLANEQHTANRAAPSDSLTTAVDQLVTLYALQQLDTAEKASLASLAQDEATGVSFALAQLQGRRNDELVKAQQGISKVNHYKGYLPSEQDGDGSVIVSSMDPKNHARLMQMSYQFIGPYAGSNLDTTGRNLGYYYLSVASRAAYDQGIMQNVRPTAFGVDLSTGYTQDTTAGRITDPVAVRRITRQLSRERATENLMPVFNENFEVIAYERSVDPSTVSTVNRSTHLGQMLGVWKGRQVEEGFSQEMNEQLIDRLKEMYDRDIQLDPARKVEYVDLFRPQTDKVIADGLKLMTYDTRAYVQQVFGKQFLVRKDMLNQVIGYRNASVGDMWTGTSRWSPAAQKTVRDMAISVFGNDAYKHLITAEKTLQNLVVDAKLLIVVKSVIVPLANFTANILQMMARGVPISDISRGLPRKLAEVDSYVKTQQRLMDAEAELGAVENDIVASRKLKTEIQSIRDSHRRMSIWPLIEAGELNSISDIGISREDILLSSGRLNQYIETMVDKLPQSVRTMARYGIISRDTALFKGLQRSIEYGDFLAKAVEYDYLTKRQGLSQKDALARITEEFVNYDYLPGRTRGALENFGLLWFWNFKIRSTKVAVSMLRNNPVHALLAQIMPFAEVGSPLDDNALSIILGGDAGWSIGPGMGINSPFLHPVMQLA